MLSSTYLSRVFFLFLTFALVVSARPQLTQVKRQNVDTSSLVTNAARLQAGLGPLKPRSFFNPTRIGAREPTTSILPVSGTIHVVKKSNSESVGYLSKNIGPLGYGVTNTNTNKMTVSFTPVAPFNIAITNGGSAYPYLGVSGDNLNNIAIFAFVATNPTSPGASPENVGNSLGGNSESSIWFYNAGSHSLTAQWINPDHSSPATHFWYYPIVNTLTIIRDPALQISGYEVFLTVA